MSRTSRNRYSIFAKIIVPSIYLLKPEVIYTTQHLIQNYHNSNNNDADAAQQNHSALFASLFLHGDFRRFGLLAVVAEKTAEKEKIESEVATLTANLDDLKTQLKAKKAELKAATKELTKAENKKAAVEAKAAEEAKKGEAEDVLKKLLASGMTTEEILAKLQ